MARRSNLPLPAVKRVLQQLGENIRLARLRRGFSAALVAERAGMSRTTLRAIEQGSASPTIGAYANALHSLGLHEQLGQIAGDDELGRKLQDAGLEPRQRAPRRRRSGAATPSTPPAP